MDYQALTCQKLHLSETFVLKPQCWHTPTGHVCVAALICPVPLLLLCYISLLMFECKTMRKRATQVYLPSPQLTMTNYDKKTRHNTSCDTLMKIDSESFACVCECVFNGIVKLRTAETVLWNCTNAVSLPPPLFVTLVAGTWTRPGGPLFFLPAHSVSPYLDYCHHIQ